MYAFILYLVLGMHRSGREQLTQQRNVKCQEGEIIEFQDV